MSNKKPRSIIRSVCAVALCFTAYAGCDNEPCATDSIRIVSRGVHVFAAYRDGNRDWETLPLNEFDTRECVVGADFQVVAVCERSPGHFEVEHVLSTPDEQGEVELPYCQPYLGDQSWIVTGEMLQAGQVFISGAGVSSVTAAPWEFELSVPNGTHHLVASNDYDSASASGDGRVAIRRGVTIDRDLTIPPIDLAIEGRRVVERDAAIEGIVAGERLEMGVDLIPIQGPPVPISTRAGVTADVLPADFVTEGESLSLHFRAMSSGAARTVEGPVDQFSALQYTLIPILSDIAFNAQSVTWVDLPWNEVSSLFFAQSSQTNSVYLQASRMWLLNNAATSLAFDSTIPGFDPAWTVSVPNYSAFGVTHDQGGISRTSIRTMGD